MNIACEALGAAHVRLSPKDWKHVIQTSETEKTEVQKNGYSRLTHAAVETVVLDALINASGMRGEHFDIHHHEGKWSTIAAMVPILPKSSPK